MMFGMGATIATAGSTVRQNKDQRMCCEYIIRGCGEEGWVRCMMFGMGATIATAGSTVRDKVRSESGSG